MPTINLYLSEEDYARLVYLAMQRKVRVVSLIQEAVQEYLAKAVNEQSVEARGGTKSRGGK